MGLITSIVFAVAAVASAAYSARQQSKAASAQRRAMAAEQRRADIANARERRQQIRNARIARAAIENQAASSGLMGSSSMAAAVSNVTTRSNENISFLDQNQMLSAQASAANIQAARFSSKAATGSAVSQLAQQFGNYSNMFNGPSPQGTG